MEISYEIFYGCFCFFFYYIYTQMEMELLDEDIRLWSAGRETNIRLLLSTLHPVIDIFSNLAVTYFIYIYILQCFDKWMNADSVARQWLVCNPTNKACRKLTSQKSSSESKAMSPPWQVTTKRSYAPTEICCREGLFHPAGKFLTWLEPRQEEDTATKSFQDNGLVYICCYFMNTSFKNTENLNIILVSECGYRMHGLLSFPKIFV